MDNSKKTKVISQLAIVISILICIVIVKLIGLIPDKLDVEYIEENYIASIESFTAENTETIMYLACIVMFPICYLIFKFLLLHILKKTKNEIIYNKIYVGINCLAIILLFIITALAFFNQGYYLTRGRVYTNLYICIPFVIVSLIITFLEYRFKENKLYKVMIYVTFAALVLFIGYVFFGSMGEISGYQRIHVDAYYYPALKINSGLTPGIDFNSIYGYYSYILALFMIPNMYSMLLFSIVISLMVMLSFTCIFMFINRFVKNKIICIYSCVFIIYCLLMQQLMASGCVYLQYVPHRILFPSIMLAYIAYYLNNINSSKKKVLVVVGYLISSVSLFWNIDTGVVVLGTWLIFLAYEVIVTNSLKDIKTYLKLIYLVLLSVLSVLIYIGAVNLIAYVRTGNIIGIMNMIYGQSNFIGSGYFMIRMELWHPWLLVAAIYIIGLALSLGKLFAKDKLDAKVLKKNMAILALTILGCGVFVYYKGRSHNSVFYSVVYPAIILLAIYLDYLVINYKKEKGIMKYLQIICIVAIMTVFSMAAITSIYSVLFNENVKSLCYKNNLKSSCYNYTKLDKLNDIIDDMQYLGDGESYFYERYKRKDVKKMPGYVDLFTYEDCKKVMDVVKENNNVCTNRKIYDILNNKYKELLDENKYEIYTDGGLYVFLNKEEYDQTVMSKIEEIGFVKVE